MPKAKAFIGGRYLDKEMVAELSDAARTVTIDHCEVEVIRDRERVVMYFKNIDRGWPLGAEVIEHLSAEFGTDETDDWLERKVQLYIDPSVKYEGRKVGGVRVRVPNETPTPTPKGGAK